MNAVEQVNLLMLVKEASRVASLTPTKISHKPVATSNSTPTKEVTSPDSPKPVYEDRLVVTKSEARESGKAVLGVNSKPTLTGKHSAVPSNTLRPDTNTTSFL